MHYERYLQSMDLLEGIHGRVLELGASDPCAFTLMMATDRPDLELSLARYDETTSKVHNGIFAIDSVEGVAPRFEFPCGFFNVEADSWPYEPHSFDAVLCLELLEHLMVDPYHLFLEASRVLKPGGRLILTTPNLASYASVARILKGDAPYNFGGFSSHGAYGRHNREWTPREVESMAAHAGFTAEVFDTRDIYQLDLNSARARALLTEQGESDTYRRQGIFYRGVSSGNPDYRYPQNLYDYDPNAHLALLDTSVRSSRVRPDEALEFQISAKNWGNITWNISGNQPTRIGFELFSPDGELISREYWRADLSRPVPPGKSDTVTVEVPAPSEPGDYELRVDMVHEQHCWFSDVQKGVRSSQVVIPITVVAT